MGSKNSPISDGSALWKVIRKHPINLKNAVCGLALPLLEIYPKETFTHFQKETLTEKNTELFVEKVKKWPHHN